MIASAAEDLRDKKIRHKVSKTAKSWKKKLLPTPDGYCARATTFLQCGASHELHLNGVLLGRLAQVAVLGLTNYGLKRSSRQLLH